MPKTKPKATLICRVPCPHCQQEIDILKETTVIAPAVKAEKEERYFAAKVLQTTLET